VVDRVEQIAGEFEGGSAPVGAELGDDGIGDDGMEPAALVAGMSGPGRDRMGEGESAR